LGAGVVEYTGGAVNRVAVRDERAQLHQRSGLRDMSQEETSTVLNQLQA